METLEKLMQIIGAASVLLSVLAHVLPSQWAFTRLCARVAVASGRWAVTPVRPTDPPASPTGKQVLPVLLVAIALQGCAFSLQGATATRLTSRAVAADTSAVPPVPALADAECDTIDREHSVASTLAAVTGGLAGAGGLTSIPMGDESVRAGLLAGAGVSGVAALGFGLWAQDRAARYVRRCGGQ